MKKSLWLINTGISALFFLLAACQNPKVQNSKESKAVEQPPQPPVKEDAANPIDRDRPNPGKVGQGPKTAPEHRSPNPGELDSLRNAMDKLREQEIKKKQKGGRP